MSEARHNVTIVVPTLNEIEHIEALIATLLPPRSSQHDGSFLVREVIVADGGSRDGTVEAVAGLAAGDPRIRLLHNPRRIQSAGINQAVSSASPDVGIIVRADAHADYPADFVERVVRTLEETGATSVVVRLRTLPGNCFQTAVAAVANSRLGSGNSVHRVGGASAFVDHGHHAGFRRTVFETLGGYDEDFAVNEDAELDSRIRASGGQIWFESSLEVGYLPRRSPWALARQYFRYGAGRARTFRKHRETLRPRQLLPPVMVAILVLCLAIGPLQPWALLVPLAYLSAAVAAGAAVAARTGGLCAWGAPLVLIITQVSWGLGFLVSLAARSAHRDKDQRARRAEH